MTKTNEIGVVGMGYATATLSSYLRDKGILAKFRFKKEVILYLKRTRSPKMYYEEFENNLNKYWLWFNKAKGDYKSLKHMLWENTKGMK